MSDAYASDVNLFQLALGSLVKLRLDRWLSLMSHKNCSWSVSHLRFCNMQTTLYRALLHILARIVTYSTANLTYHNGLEPSGFYWRVSPNDEGQTHFSDLRQTHYMTFSDKDGISVLIYQQNLFLDKNHDHSNWNFCKYFLSFDLYHDHLRI